MTVDLDLPTGVTPTPLALLLLGRDADPAASAGSSARVTCPPRPIPIWYGEVDGARRAGRPRLRSRPPLPARRGDRVRGRHRRLVQAGARRGRPAGGGLHRVLRRPLHGRERRRPDLGLSAGRAARPGGGLLDGGHGRPGPGEPRRGRSSRTPAWRADTVPVTYMNSSADIKAFTGRHGGTICTSSNARARSSGRSARARRCCSCPTSIWAATPPCCRWACRSMTASSTIRTRRAAG